MALEVGQIVEGKVTGITNFGCFVQLPDGKDGLVHISEVARGYVERVTDHLKMNQQVKVKVLSIDEKGKVGLSIKQALPAPPKRVEPTKRTGAPAEFSSFSKPVGAEESFEEKMKRFQTDSNERMQGLRINETRRTRRPKRNG